MRTDRELLELAAKAAGIDYHPEHDLQKVPTGWHNWNPPTDDGDALRLAVKLRLSIIHSVEGPAMVMSHEGATSCNEATGIDGAAITRRAIVRAAAEISAQVAARQNGESDG